MEKLLLLVVGGSGFLGTAILAQARAHGAVLGTYHTRVPEASEAPGPWTPVDVRDASAVDRIVRAFAPRVVVNASVSASPDVARAVIEDGAAHTALAAHEHGAAFIQISSDMVFDGESGPFDEDSPPSPIFPYGRLKAEAERRAREAHAKTVIVRCPLLYRVDPPDPSTGAWLGGVRAGKGYALFTDELRCPAPVDDVADAIVRIAARLAAGESLPRVLHLPGPESVSRYAFGRLVLEAHGLDPELALPADPTARASAGPRPRDLTMLARTTPREFTSSIRSPKEALPKLRTTAATPAAAHAPGPRADRAARRS